MLAVNRSSQRIALAIIFASAAQGTGLPAQAVRVGEDVSVRLGLERTPLIEPHLVIHPKNPDHLLGAAFTTNPALSVEERVSRQRCVSFLSGDGGVTWQRHDFLITGSFDPWVAITPDGHAVFTALGRDPGLPQQGGSGIVVYHSADGGRTWDERPVGLGNGHDHQTVVVDGSSPERQGWLYVVSSRTVSADHGTLRFSVSVARSRNGGRTFDPQVHIRPNNLFIAAETPAVLSDGTLIVSFVEAARNDQRTLLIRRRGWVVRSTDGGHTFSLPMFVNEACGSPTAFSLSALVADVSSGPFKDRLYFGCNLQENRGVTLNYSADRGESWSEPKPVHSTGGDTLAFRKLMAMAVNKDGVVGVVSVGGRKTPGNACYNVYFSASLDGGDTFLPEQGVSSVTSCFDPAVNGTAWSEGGDYYGIATDDRGRFRLLWSDARAGLFQLRTAVVEVDEKAVRRN